MRFGIRNLLLLAASTVLLILPLAGGGSGSDLDGLLPKRHLNHKGRSI